MQFDFECMDCGSPEGVPCRENCETYAALMLELHDRVQEGIQNERRALALEYDRRSREAHNAALEAGRKERYQSAVRCVTESEIFKDLAEDMRKQIHVEPSTEAPPAFPLSIGEIMTLLSLQEGKILRFDFGSAVPTSFGSWRGDYSKLALGYRLVGYDATEPGPCPHVDDLVSPIGETFPGWKGGEFLMTEDSRPVYVSNRGNSGATVITGVLVGEHSVTILTSLLNH